MPCPNCTRLERAIFELIAGDGQTLQALQPAINAAGIPLSPEVARALDPIAFQGQQIIAGQVIKKKRKVSAYSRKYGKAFKRVAGQYKKKSGGWKKNGFKNAQKAAHKLAKK